jgi:tetratricopeptide (TPR) repeat protein
MELKLFQTDDERLKLGVQGNYPEYLIERTKEGAENKHTINESLTRPWIRHYFIIHLLRKTGAQDDIITRDLNILDIFKTTIPLVENSFVESALNSWQMFLGSAFRDAETPWYNGIKKFMAVERFYTAIEQLELEIPISNSEHSYQFLDHQRTPRKLPRVPIKFFFALPGNEREILIGILRQAINNNPHNTDLALLTYCFFKAWGRTRDFLNLMRQENRSELEEWYYWVENDMTSLGALKRDSGDFTTAFFIYDRANFSAAEYKEIADWFLKESEFKSAYHFYYKAKQFETAIELLQNISVKEFGELTICRRLSKGERTPDQPADPQRFASLYQEEMETLRGFARIRTAETYKQISVKARQHFDRETVETKYAFGELSEDEYHRLIRQIQERKQ